MKLPSGWYAVSLSGDIKQKPVGLKRFGVNLVAFRVPDKSVVVLEDKCPHRFAKLSHGKIVGNTIECPFHGFRYDQDGICVDAPEFHHGLSKLCAKKYDAYESDGIIWIWWGNQPAADLKPKWFSQAMGARTDGFRQIWPCHISRCVENQLDYAHLPFVHRRTIGRFAMVGKKPHIVYSNEGVRFSFSESTELETSKKERFKDQFIEFRYPNFWMNLINPQFCITLIFVPIDEEHTELILRSHHLYSRLPLVSWLIGKFLNWMNRIILAEDRKVVLTQEPNNSLLGQGEQLYANDEIIRHYRKWFLGESQ